MLLTWLILYSPFILPSLKYEAAPLRELLFRTPAYLWYLSAVCFAVIPFCLVKNRKALWVAALFLYVIGTWMSDSYSWVYEGEMRAVREAYQAHFLTTRNGLFFALPCLCIGEYAWKKSMFPSNCTYLLISMFIFFTEITIVRSQAERNADTSMYLTMLPFTYQLLRCLLDIKVSLNTHFLRSCSEKIYLMQFGIIHIMGRLCDYADITSNEKAWIIYIAAICLPMLFVFVSQKDKKMQA